MIFLSYWLVLGRLRVITISVANRVWITDFDSRMCRNFESKIEQRVDFGTDLDDD
jgi:hypothetical protein